ncbi:hypothetical protein [Paenarthrobacter sp. NPDC091669]|uniref:hypothetical protein n=1 Tax=Paenarthrobacter sp. NPDC091669 TaxID=3364384 RepID=UPI003827F714
MSIILEGDMGVRYKPVLIAKPFQFPKFSCDGFLLALEPRLCSSQGRLEHFAIFYGIA